MVMNGSFVKRADRRVIQELSPLEMTFISQPPNTHINDLRNFAFKSQAGSGVTVYLQDGGVNFGHEEFQSSIGPEVIRGRYRCLSVRAKNSRWARLMALFDETPDRSGHGTCVADKVVGATHGVAKGADLAMATHDNSWSSLLNGLSMIIDDILIERARRNGHFYPVLCLT